mgnify:CR=1 FL=1
MTWTQIEFNKLNARQKENFNFQKIAAVLADYGFNCIKLTDDWNGADFLAYHIDGETTLKVQLKSRLTVAKKYQYKNIYMAFPINDKWCLIEHDELLTIVNEVSPSWFQTVSWNENGKYGTGKVSLVLQQKLQPYLLQTMNTVSEF